MGVLIVEKRTEKRLIGLTNFFVRHWLAVLIVLTAIFILPIIGYPVMMATGNPVLQSIAGTIQTAYHMTCHQLPERSLFIEGYEMAVCSRCFAIYAAFLAGCVAFAFFRTKLKIWSIVWYIVLCVPMAIDGFAQLFSVAIPRTIGPGWQIIWTVESTNELRLITGVIFGLASALYVLPYLQEIFNGDMNDPVKNEAPAGSEQGPVVKQ